MLPGITLPSQGNLFSPTTPMMSLNIHAAALTFEKVIGDHANGLPAAPDGIMDVTEVALAWQEVSGLETTAECVAF